MLEIRDTDLNREATCLLGVVPVRSMNVFANLTGQPVNFAHVQRA